MNRADYCFTNDDEVNDGLVSLISSRGPHAGISEGCGNQYCAPTSLSGATVIPGKWYYKDFTSMDHLQVVGFKITAPLWENPVSEVYTDTIAPFINSYNPPLSG
jgi:hypothetical protein